MMFHGLGCSVDDMSDCGYTADGTSGGSTSGTYQDVIDATAANQNALNPLPGQNTTTTIVLPGSPAPTGSASTGFNWGNFVASIFPTVANDATKLGQQALATPGTVLLPNGTIAVGTAQGQPSLAQTLGSSSSLLPILLIGGVGLVVIMMAKK